MNKKKENRKKREKKRGKQGKWERTKKRLKKGKKASRVVTPEVCPIGNLNEQASHAGVMHCAVQEDAQFHANMTDLCR